MKRNVPALLLCIALSLSLFSGCAAPAVQPTPTPVPVETPAATPAPTAGPIVLTDQTGRAVTLDAPAKKIVSGYYISTSACIALGLKESMAGIENKIIPIYDLAAPAFHGLPKVGTAKQFDLEGCLALDPDLVILPKKLKDAAETLSQHGVPVLLVNPENQEQLVDMLTLIGKATGTEDTAAALADAYRLGAEELSGLVPAGGDYRTPRVYMAGNGSYLTTAPRDMYQATLIRMGGGSNAADALEGDAWTEVSYEQLLAMDPEVILLPSDASYTVDDVLADAQLSEVSAVRAGHVFAMPGAFEAWDSPVPSCILGSKWIMAVLHPDLYPMSQMREDAAVFYRTFYGFEIDPSLITDLTTDLGK